MAKQHRRAQISRSKNHSGHIVEEVFDDNLLPDASEIAKLSELDPDIMAWLKKRAEKEQEFRHTVYSKRVDLVSKTERGLRWINYLGLMFSFILLSGFIVLSYALITRGHQVLGSIFSGVTLLAIGSMFLSKVRSNNYNKSK